MPIEGLPDHGKHRVCMRCTQWFEPDEGSAAVRQSLGISGGIADGIRNAAGEVDLRFICDRCAAVRRRRKLALYGVLVLALLWAVVKEAGWL
jgi:hypothetical protein